MAVKQPLNINFSKGLDLKTDPFQVATGNFLKLENSVREKGGMLKKRNGFGKITSLPDTSYSYLTTFNGGLTAIGANLSSYSQASATWFNKGALNPVDLKVNALVRNTFNQTYADSAIADNGFVCTAYLESNGSSTSLKYTISDNSTTQTIVAPTLIAGTGTASFAPRVFYLDPYFIIVFDDLISSTNNLKYLAISSVNPGAPVLGVISTLYSAASTGTFDGAVVNNKLYLFWNSTSSTIKCAYLTNNLAITTAVSFSDSAVTIGVTIDNSGAAPIVWAAWVVPSTGRVKALAVDGSLNTVLAPTQIIATSTSSNIAPVASGGVLTVYLEVQNSGNNFVNKNTLTQAGVAGTAATVARSIGLASKAFIYNGTYYFLGLYYSTLQSTYFLMSDAGKVIARFAYENGPNGYYVTGLPGINLTDNLVQIPYIFKDLIQSVNKNTNIPAGNQIAGIYSQTGINLVNISFGTSAINTAEIGNNLNISGGFVSSYDGTSLVEQNFFLFPEGLTVTTATTGGALTAQQYFYQGTYEWTDNQGNAYRSAPSVPVSITTTGTASLNSIVFPTLRLSYKATSVKLVLYRWSTGQQEYFQVTSISSPTLNDPTSDSITITDGTIDTSILGNNLIYTNGGVVEDVAPPASSNLFLFDDRMWAIDAEDRNLLWFSKQVIEATPVEFSDLFTLYVAPTTASEGSSGELNCGFPMDDKAIFFKDNAIYYINGTGPDNTGTNNQYSQPIFITSTVGCANPNSIVLTPNGLMFQSNKGIWLLGRDLATQYIGAPVEDYNSSLVKSAINVPGTNQVRFTLDSGTTLMYDYYFGQWGTFEGIPGISSTLYMGAHTFINSLGQSYTETPGIYLDGSNPVLMAFSTAWLNLAGLRGYERAYFFNFLGVYLSPHKLTVQVAYDYESPSQQDIYSPQNYSGPWGSDPNWGGSQAWGGSSKIEQFRVFNQTQKCKSFQILVQETFDPSFGTIAGAGLTLSGICAVIGIKSGYAPTIGANSIG